MQLILALETSLSQFLVKGMDHRFKAHREGAEEVRRACTKLGLVMVAKEGMRAHTLTAVYYPEGAVGGEFLKAMNTNGVIVAGGFEMF